MVYLDKANIESFIQGLGIRYTFPPQKGVGPGVCILSSIRGRPLYHRGGGLTVGYYRI